MKVGGKLELRLDLLQIRLVKHSVGKADANLENSTLFSLILVFVVRPGDAGIKLLASFVVKQLELDTVFALL